jgi:hypothetical protein
MLVCVFGTIGFGSFIYSVGGATIYDRTNARPANSLTLLFDFSFYTGDHIAHVDALTNAIQHTGL